MTLPQEKEEQDILYTHENLSYHERFNLGPIKNALKLGIKIDENQLFSALPKGPSNLSIQDTVDRYINNFNDYNIFADMQKNWTAKDYMEREHQKSFAKAYFVPLLQKVLNFCHKKGYKDMAQAMAYNIKDETGQWPAGEGLEIYQDEKHYINPEHILGEEYRGEAHEKRREYEYNGLLREYGQQGDIQEITKEGRNVGMKIFNIITGELLSTENENNGYEAIGAVMFLEKFIPHEFRFMQTARDKLFAGLDKKEKHYIDDHILHDEEFHYQDIIKGLDSMTLEKKEKELVLNGIHKIYMGREFIFSAFANQIKPSTITKILNIPMMQYIKKYGIAASIVLGMSLLGKYEGNNHKNTQIVNNIYEIENIKQYEEKIAKENGVREEYSSGKSTNFVMIDYIGYESLRQAIKDQKGVDIGPYAL